MVLLSYVLSSYIMETEYCGETTTSSGKKDIKDILSLHQLFFILRYTERCQWTLQAAGGGDFFFVGIIKAMLTILEC